VNEYGSKKGLLIWQISRSPTRELAVKTTDKVLQIQHLHH
jgi:hypothetical protein